MADRSAYTPVISGAEPFFFPGGPCGCLLVHGFTGAPKEMRGLGEYLAGRGHTVLGVRLAGHATRPQDMLHLRWQDWLHSVEDGWHLLHSALCGYDPAERSVFILGLSVGGVLSLLFSARFPVEGVVAMSTPYALPHDWRLPYTRLFAYVQPRVAKGPPDWRDPLAAQDHIDYPYYPTRAIAELLDLLAEMRLALPRVQVPTLLVHSRDDGGVAPHNAEQIYAALGTADKELLWVQDCGHVITREPQRERVFEAAAGFIERVRGRRLSTEAQAEAD